MVNFDMHMQYVHFREKPLNGSSGTKTKRVRNPNSVQEVIKSKLIEILVNSSIKDNF